MSSLPLPVIPITEGPVKVRLFHVDADNHVHTQHLLAKLLHKANAYLLDIPREGARSSDTPWRRIDATTIALTMHCSECAGNLARTIFLGGPRSTEFRYTADSETQDWPAERFSSGGSTAVVLHQLPGGRHRQLDIVCHLLHRASLPAPLSIDDIKSLHPNILRVPVPDQAGADRMCALSRTIYATKDEFFFEFQQTAGDTTQTYNDFVRNFVGEFLPACVQRGPRGLVAIEPHNDPKNE